jgi:hypothetical protein
MNSQKDTRAYDLFKLIVALILLALLIILSLSFRGAGTATGQTNVDGLGSSTGLTQTAAAKASAAETEAVAAAKTATAEAAAAALPAATASPTTAPAATATTAPTATLAPTATQAAPSPTPTAAAVTPTQAATPTATEAAPTPTSAPPIASGDCSAAIPSRLSPGMRARVESNLNFRSSPDIASNLIRVNPVGTQFDIISGPVCTPFGNGAYLWWEVRSADGSTGWSAEGTLDGKFYFLAPLQ